jgi:quercetin dioxygenase-like cupin family protein
MLQQVDSTGGMCGMIRMEAGSSIPAHSHMHADHAVFVIEGDLIDEGVTYG